MSKEIIISVSGEQSRIAIVEDGELVELYVESPENVRTIGDIYLAKVRRILPGIKAAFVDIGQKQDAFLHFSDLSDNLPGLIELADGKVPERKAPPAAQEETAEADEKPARSRRAKADDEAPTEERKRSSRSSRRGRAAETDEAAPAILPPDAEQVETAGSTTDAPTPDTDESEETPKRSRRRRRRRGRGRGRAETASTETGSADAASEDSTDEDAQPEVTQQADAPAKSRSRRGRAKAAEAAPSDDATQPESSSTDEADEKPKRSRRGRAKSEPRAQSEPSPRAAAPSAAPSILPPDSVEEDEPVAEAPANAAAETPEDQPAKPKRARRASRKKENPEAEAEAVAETPKQTEAPDAEPAKPKSRRSRSRKPKAAETDTPADAAPETTSKPTTSDSTASEQATSEQEAETPAETAEPVKKKRPARRKKKADEPVAEPTAEAKPADAKASKATPDEPKAADAKPTRSKAAKTEPAKPEQTPSEPAEPAAKKALPSTASPFVIDLTSKPARKLKREEEEEEEEKRGGRSRRRRGGSKQSSRSGSRSRGRRSGKNDDANDQDTVSTDTNDDAPNSTDSNGNSNGNGRRTARTDDDTLDRDTPKKPSDGRHPSEHLKQDQRLIVKIVKEPISSKGTRVSTDISLAGRFLVLVPAADYVAVSKKIDSAKERRRLKALGRSLLPEGFGLIIRTVAEGRDAKALDADLKLLLDKWGRAEATLKKRPNPPVQLYEDVNMVSSIVRDLFSDDYDRILIDDKAAYEGVRSYVQAVAPQMADAVKFYDGKEPVFRHAKIERDVRAAFERKVTLPGGGYLFIETTEAMHVVDVNSGRAGRGLSQEQNALKVNVESAKEIAKQLRLRDLGGIICVDFIDMRSEAYRRKVYDALKQEFRKDRAVTKLLPMSDFGVVEITRQRLRPSITTTLEVDDIGPMPEEDEPVADAPEAQAEAPARSREADDRPVRSAEEIIEHLERWIRLYRDEVQDQHRLRPIVIRVHPFFASTITRGIPSRLTRWKFATRLKLKLEEDDRADPLSFSIRDEKSGKNLTRKYDPDRRS